MFSAVFSRTFGEPLSDVSDSGHSKCHLVSQILEDDSNSECHLKSPQAPPSTCALFWKHRVYSDGVVCRLLFLPLARLYRQYAWQMPIWDLGDAEYLSQESIFLTLVHVETMLRFGLLAALPGPHSLKICKTCVEIQFWSTRASLPTTQAASTSLMLALRRPSANCRDKGSGRPDYID